MNLLSLETIQKNHRRELEQRLDNAKSNLKNLDRMAEEAFREIDRRATEDKETLSKIFHTLTANEEVHISSLREELGLNDNIKEIQNQFDISTGVAAEEQYLEAEPIYHNIKKPKNGGKKDAAL